MKNKLDFPSTEILSNLLGDIFWVLVLPPGALTLSSYTTATYANAKIAPNVQGQGFKAEVNPLSLLTHICATRTDAALQCM